MALQSRQRDISAPEVNLVPMLDVLMSVLTFFIITAMTLSGTPIGGVRLPETAVGSTETELAADPAIVGLTADARLVYDDRELTLEQLTVAIAQYLNDTPEGTVILKADRSLDYGVVSAVLQELNRIGGDRVSLAIEE